MKYSVHPSVWANAFAVPTQLVDKHLKIASGQQLKVFLWLVRHNADEFDFEELVNGVGMKAEEVKDNMQYWIEKGLVACDDIELRVIKKEELPKKSNKEQVQTKEESRITLKDIPDIAPTHEHVAKRLLESPELNHLYNEAQARFGRTVGFDTQAKLLMIHDHYGLPIEVILMIIEYAVIKGKSSMAYITKVSKDWGEREINTLEKADEQIQKLCEHEQIWKDFVAMFEYEPPKFTEKRSEYLNKWNKQMGFSLEMIYQAYEETLNNVNKFNLKYTDKILSNWKEKNVGTKADLTSINNKHTNKFTPKSKTPDKSEWNKNEASYNIDKIKEKARGPLIYKRREG